MSVSSTLVRSGFDQFDLHPQIVRGIAKAGFTEPRSIQLDAIPACLNGQDVLGLAQTGTGKTAAFALPILDRIMASQGSGPRALVIAPTRELAAQITDEFKTLGRFTKIKVATIFGGVSVRDQIRELRQRPEVVVGCPGRLLDLISQRVLHLERVETLVLDEADHMFDMGFLPDIRRILAELPAQRQNLLFSATMPKEIRRLANQVLNEPVVVELADDAPAQTIEHALFMIAERSKRPLLENILGGQDCDSAIVFTRTKHRARRLASQLEKAGHRAVALQGNMSQSQRDRAMRGFRKRQFDVLVATDIAARGIDVKGVSHVINYDVPNTPQAYTHRIGRTGRAELEGIAFTFVTENDRAWLKATERMIGSSIPQRRVPKLEMVPREAPESVRSAPHPRGRSDKPGRRSDSKWDWRKRKNSRSKNGAGEGAAADSRGGKRKAKSSKPGSESAGGSAKPNKNRRRRRRRPAARG